MHIITALFSMNKQQLIPYLLMVSVKQGEETSLRACGAFYASEANIVSRSFDIAQVPEQFLRKGHEIQI